MRALHIEWRERAHVGQGPSFILLAQLVRGVCSVYATDFIFHVPSVRHLDSCVVGRFLLFA